jgi:hypothetical protein
MKLFIPIVTLLFICSCKIPGTIAKDHALAAEPSMPFTIVIETLSGQQSIDEVVAACKTVRMYKDVQISDITEDKVQIKIIYKNLTYSERERLLSQLREISWLTVVQTL